ncbi:MAG: DUF1501 domain-containing protein [Planctomycetia bacterium]|nr:DUF1501 domain-containing protein [Planctomycetia bacterium]
MSIIRRRDLLKACGVGFVGYSMSGWLPAFANAIAQDPKRKRHCILLWMTGGPAQTDTWDMKPGHANGGQFKEIETAAAGLRFSEHLPKLAKLADQLAVIRSLSTKEGDHGRGTYLMRTGHQPGGPISFPCIGSTLSKALGSADAELPNYVSIAPYEAFNRAAFGPGFLGPRSAPLTVAATNFFQQPQPQQQQPAYAELGVDDLRNPGVDRAQEDARLALWQSLQDGFLKKHKSASPVAHNTVYQRAVRMMRSDAAKAFDLAEEKGDVRERYGKGRFGQGCLMARRLVERGVPFVEVSLGSAGGGAFAWDTHAQNFPTVKSLSEELDAGWSALMSDLKDRGLLEATTILWMGEFGRTPKINGNAGRDHFPAAWSAVLAGGGIKGGQAFGKTSEDGEKVEEGKVDVGDVLATLCRALGVDPETKNISEIGRPIAIAEGAPIEAILA